MKRFSDFNSLCVIDIGTNSILFLICKTDDAANVLPLYQQAVTTRLGEGISRTGFIKDEALARTIEQINKFTSYARRSGCSKFKAVGTHVFRDASNGKEAAKAIADQTGIDIEILDEHQESMWSFYGVVETLNIESEVTVVDIGGGSTEIVTGTRDNITCYHSIKIGGVNLTEKFLRHDPPTGEELMEMNERICSSLGPRALKLLKNGCITIGLGGSVTTLAAIDLNMKKYDASKINSHVLSIQKIEEIFNNLSRLKLFRRKRILKIDPARADIIIAGAAILLTAMKLTGLSHIRVSDRGLRFGIAKRELICKYIGRYKK